jgi:hypothetical protein
MLTRLFLLAVAGTAAARSCKAKCGSQIGLVSGNGPDLFIEYDGTTLNVPQQCRQQTCDQIQDAATASHSLLQSEHDDLKGSHQLLEGSHQDLQKSHQALQAKQQDFATKQDLQALLQDFATNQAKLQDFATKQAVENTALHALVKGLRAELGALKAVHSADQTALSDDLDGLETAFQSADAALQQSIAAVSDTAGSSAAPLVHMRAGYYADGGPGRDWRVDTQSNAAYIDYTQCFDRAGTIESIRFYSGRANQKGHRFQLYRRAGQDQYKCVRQTEEISTPFKGGVQTFVPAGGMAVLPGDCVGWQHSGMGTVKYCQHHDSKCGGLTTVLWRMGTVSDQETATFRAMYQTRKYDYTIDWQPTSV